MPIFEQLDHKLGRAITLGLIADLLEARGDYVEALLIYQEEVLPAFEQLGYVYEQSLVLYKIANLFHKSGKYNDSLRICKRLLRMCEQIGNKSVFLKVRTKIGINYLARGAAGDRQRGLRILKSILQDAQRLKLSEAGQIADAIRQAENSPESN